MSILLLVSLCLTGVSQEATGASNDSGLSRQQILKMGLDNFIRLYSSHHHHKPDEAACLIYCEYKTLDNHRRIACLSRRHKRQVKQLSDALQKWEDTALHLRCDLTDGGTAWIGDLTCSPAYFEEYLGHSIGCYEHPHHPSRSHSIPAAQTIQGDYLLLKHCEKLLADEDVVRIYDFRRTLPLFRKQTAKLHKTLALQSPTVQRLIAEHLNKFANLM